MKQWTYKLILSYDGTNYYGYQKQPYLKTIQSVLENALFKLTKQKIMTFAASRTDKGVHAYGQVVHFKTSFLFIPAFFQKALNKILPYDIKVLEITHTFDNFHARYEAKSKIYQYFFSKKPLNPFNSRFQVYFSGLNFLTIRKAMLLLEGKNDFILFTNNKDLKKNTIRIIYRSFLKETKKQYILFFHGESFLKQMILFLVGFLIKIGQNQKTISDLKDMLKLKYNKKIPFLAPSCGLFLTKIFY